MCLLAIDAYCPITCTYDRGYPQLLYQPGFLLEYPVFSGVVKPLAIAHYSLSAVKVISVNPYFFRFGYVEFNSTKLAKKALESLNGAELDGRQLRLDFAGPRGSGGGESGGGRRFGDKWTPRGGRGGTPRGGRGGVFVCASSTSVLLIVLRM